MILRRAIPVAVLFACSLSRHVPADETQPLELRISDVMIEKTGVKKQCRGQFTIRNEGRDYEVPPGVVGPSYGVFIYNAKDQLLFRNFGGWAPDPNRGQGIPVRWNTSSNHLGQTSEPPFVIPAPGKYTLKIELYKQKRDQILDVATKEYEAR